MRFYQARPSVSSLFRRLQCLPEADAKVQMEIPAASSHPQDPSASDLPTQKRPSMFTWGSTLRMCPGLGNGFSVPCFLRSDKPVVVATVSKPDLIRSIKEFWDNRDVDTRVLHQMMPEVLKNFFASFSSSERGALELSYSVWFALEELRTTSSEVALFYHAAMMDVDESCRFCVNEIRNTLQTIIQGVGNNAEKFLHEVLTMFPWTLQIQSELASILHPFTSEGKEFDPKVVLSNTTGTRMTSFAEYLVCFFISHRRRLLQRIFHGLTRAATSSFPPEEELSANDLLYHMVEEVLTDVHDKLTQEEIDIVAKVAIGVQPIAPGVLSYIATHREAASSVSGETAKNKDRSKTKGANGSQQVWPLSHQLFPQGERIDEPIEAEDDLRVVFLMRNLMRLLPEEEAAAVNRVFAKLEGAFLTRDQDTKLVPSSGMSSPMHSPMPISSPLRSRPVKPMGMEGRVEADVFYVKSTVGGEGGLHREGEGG
jgi:hypothetical protein